MSGLSARTSRIARRALEKFIGLGLAFRRVAMLSILCCLRSPIVLIQAVWGWICPGLSMARNEDMADPISATTGAAIGRLLSISVGEMSTCMKRAVGDQGGALPCPRSQFNRAPINMTTSAWARTKERAAAAD